MAKEKFILVSLKDDESKKLAQIVTNDTSRKILDFLAEQESTESEMAEKLNIPISTIHYNLQALVNAKLVESEEYHYSKKGKEVSHYKIANKYIIIAPKSTYGIKERLKSILPIGILAVIGSFLIYLISSIQTLFGKTGQVLQAAPMAQTLENEAPRMLKTVAESAADTAANTMPQAAAEPSFWQSFIQTPALWFLFGCIFTLLLIIIGEYIHYKRTK